MKDFIVMILLIFVGVSCKVKDEASFHSVVDRDSVSRVSKNDRTLHSQEIKSETVKDIKIDTVYPGCPQIDTLQYLVDKEFTNMDSIEINAIIRYSFNPYHEFFNELYNDVLGAALISDQNLFECLIAESRKFKENQQHQIIETINNAMCWHCYVTYSIPDSIYEELLKMNDNYKQTVLNLQAFRDSLATDTEGTIRAVYGSWDDTKSK